ncbi:KH domain-containing protein [bacterium]|nr:MAG: KH domain-containing protein [bacterium]
MIELVGYLVQGIVSHPEEVEVEEFFDEVGTVYGVRVHPEDIGRVIGKEGRVANALRHVVKAAATKVGTHVTVEILTEDGAQTIAEASPEI